jgi:hypothetical protein
MKIAVCFSGMVRTSNYVTPNLLRYFGNLFPNIDFFMHTWNITQHKQYTIGAMALLSDNYKNCSIESSYPIICNMVNDYKNFKKIKIEEFSNECKIYNSFPLWYSWVQSIKLKEEYENEYNFKYDVVLKMRPDMIFPEDSTLQKEIDNFLNNPELFYVMGGDESRLNDVYFLSSSDNMNIATKIIDNPSWQENELNIHLLKNNINYGQVLNPSYAIYREECFGVSPTDWLGCHMIETYYYSEKKTFDMYCTTQLDFLNKFLELYEFLMKRSNNGCNS